MPVVVREAKVVEGCHGVCIVGDGRALIRIASDSPSIMCDTLLEEWAHVLRHGTPVPIDDEHDVVFWAILSLITKQWRGE
jgi:hypothetical protein